jgi:hypothetical protein
MGEPERRRRRLRPSSSTAVPAPAPPDDDAAVEPPRGPSAVTAAVPIDPSVMARATTGDAGSGTSTASIGDPVEGAEPARPTDRMSRPGRGGYGRRIPPGPGGDDREMERGLRGLVGSGSSQVSVGAALRARDAARPGDEHIADAEADLVIVRRNWIPREELPRNP